MTAAAVEEKIAVPLYGIHWTADGIAYLHQGRAATNFLSLKQASPFVVQTPRRLPCNHLFPVSAVVPDASHWKQFQQLVTDPLVKAMLPLPKDALEAGVFILEDTNDEMNVILLSLSRMSSPIAPIVRPIWHFTATDLRTELTRTNVQPLVLTQANPKHQRLIDEVANQCLTTPRRVVITGTADLIVRKPAQRIRSTLLAGEESPIISLPLEALGMTALRRYARREDPLSDLPAPRGRSA
jgi:hypothetical protein